MATNVVGVGLDRAEQAQAGAGQKANKSMHGNASRSVDAVWDFIIGSGSG